MTREEMIASFRAFAEKGCYPPDSQQCGEAADMLAAIDAPEQLLRQIAEFGEAQNQVPLTDEQERALCEGFYNAAASEYFKARPQLESDINRRIFYAGHRKAWIEYEAAHGIKESK